MQPRPQNDEWAGRVLRFGARRPWKTFFEIDVLKFSKILKKILHVDNDELYLRAKIQSEILCIQDGVTTKNF